jgi:hypothetical protein
MSEPERRVVEVRGAMGAMIALDHDALRFDYPHRAPSWMPLDRIGGLVLEGPIGLGPGVIEALIDSDVQVRWRTRKGKPVAELWPDRPQHQDIAARLDELMRQPDWASAYSCWRLRQLIWDVRDILRESPGHKVPAISPDHPARLARSILPGRPGEQRLLDRLGVFLRFDARRLLIQRGWPLERLREPRPGPDVARDISLSMLWEAVAALRQAPLRSSDRPIDWYARQRQRLHLRGQCTYLAFVRWMADRLAERRH